MKIDFLLPQTPACEFRNPLPESVNVVGAVVFMVVFIVLWVVFEKDIKTINKTVNE